MVTKEEVFEDFKSMVEPIVVFLHQDDDGPLFCIAASLYQKSVEMGSIKPNEDEGYIDQDTLVALHQFTDSFLRHIRLMTDVMDGKVRLHIKDGNVMFSHREIMDAYADGGKE